MPENTDPPLHAGTGAKEEVALLDVLSLLMKSGKARTTADLAKYAAQYGAPEAEERLRVMEAEGIPMALAFDAVSAHLRILSHKRNSTLLAGCRGKKVGVVLNIPPHVAELFVAVAQVTFLQPDDGPLHGALHRYEDRVIKGGRACRAKTQEMDALVFEAFREDGQLFVDASVGDVLEPKMLPAGVQLIAHLRPHGNPQDVKLHTLTSVAFI